VILRALLAVPAALLAAAPVAAAATLVLTGGTVIDGYGNPPLHNGVIIVEGDRISAVGTLDSLAIPADAEVISTEGMTVLPGLWDMQVYLSRLGHGDEQRWAETYQPIAERVVMPLAAAQLLQAGVTSARVLGTPAAAAVNVRNRIREGRIPGPTLFVTGAQLGKAVGPGAEDWQVAVAGADDARSRVTRLAAAGVDYLLLSQLDLWSEDELAAAVNEARVRGLSVFAWADRAAAIERGLQTQIDGFLGLGLGAVGDFPPELVAGLVARVADNRLRPLSWSPAISGILNYEDLRRNPEPLDDPAAVAGLPPLVAADLLASLQQLGRLTWYDMPASRAATLCSRLRQLKDARVRLVLGSDSGAPAHLHTRAAWQEIDYWVRDCGLDPLLAIQAATHDAAAAMQVEHESGTLTAGKYADIIAVRGDVLRTPALLQHVDVVIRHGLRYR
jgi:imidazolonepropionase-like amidohydrolase